MSQLCAEGVGDFAALENQLLAALKHDGASTWGFVDSYSPEVLSLVCRAAALAGSYEAASQDLLTYAGLAIDARQLQRLVRLMAPVMNRWRQAQQPSLPGASCGEVMCVGTDGTGAPMRRRHLRGRKGKQGRARTREVKVGTVFTHRKPSLPDQRPERPFDFLPGGHCVLR